MTLVKSCSPFMFFSPFFPPSRYVIGVFLFVFETWFSVAQVDLNLAPSQRMALHN